MFPTTNLKKFTQKILTALEAWLINQLIYNGKPPHRCLPASLCHMSYITIHVISANFTVGLVFVFLVERWIPYQYGRLLGIPSSCILCQFRMMLCNMKKSCVFKVFLFEEDRAMLFPIFWVRSKNLGKIALSVHQRYSSHQLCARNFIYLCTIESNNIPSDY